jgi:histidine triad (HIT) family protein
MSNDCIFCRIVAGEIPATMAGENEAAVAFYDLKPQAPVHILIVPRAHICGVREIAALPAVTVQNMFVLANDVAAETGIAESGYRLITNDGADAGQTVFHLHWHLLGGTALSGEFA